MKEVIERAAFFKSWVDDGIPSTFPLYAFFFTQAFLTGSKQNFARSHKIEIDKVDFDYAVLDGDESTYTEKPRMGGVLLRHAHRRRRVGSGEEIVVRERAQGSVRALPRGST